MSQKVSGMKAKFEALIIRERLLIVGSLAALIYIVCDLGFMQSTQRKIKDLTLKEESIRKDMDASSTELKVFETALKNNPNKKLKIELDRLRNKLEELDVSLKSFSVGLIAADTLPMMLHDVLQKNTSLKLVSMITSPSEEIRLGGDAGPNTISDHANALRNPVLAQALKDSDAATTERRLNSGQQQKSPKTIKLYKHSVELTFTGTYSNVLSYISSLEQDHWRFYWESLSYDVDSYPNADINMKVFTLSSERGAFDGS